MESAVADTAITLWRFAGENVDASICPFLSAATNAIPDEILEVLEQQIAVLASKADIDYIYF
jgi:hypothetical protein